jgi:hypothetical protein
MIRKEYEYRRNAIVSVELARRTASPNDKAHLLKLAEAWLDLAKLTTAVRLREDDILNSLFYSIS